MYKTLGKMQHAVQTFAMLFSVSVIRYFFVAGTAFIICYIWFDHRLGASKIQNKAATRRDFTREILHSIQTTVILTGVACIILYTPVKHITRVYTIADHHPAWWLLITVPLSLVIHDTYFYWMHRLLHHPKIFRHAHLLHHRSTNPSPWTSYSFHFFEACAESLSLLVITIVIPMSINAISLFVLIAFIINVYGHLGYEVAPKWLRKTKLFKLINTSVHHNLHHSKFNANYGLYFRYWDRLMGTEHPDYVREYDRVQQNRVERNNPVIETPVINQSTI